MGRAPGLGWRDALAPQPPLNRHYNPPALAVRPVAQHQFGRLLPAHLAHDPAQETGQGGVRIGNAIAQQQGDGGHAAVAAPQPRAGFGVAHLQRDALQQAHASGEVWVCGVHGRSLAGERRRTRAAFNASYAQVLYEPGA